MTAPDGPPDRLQELAFSILSMKVLMPGDEPVDMAFGSAYFDAWREAEALHGDEADEFMFLAMADMATWLVEYLTDITGQPAEHWLGRVRADFVDGGS